MKGLLYAYILALLATLPTAGYAFSLSEEVPEGVVVSSLVIDGSEDLKSDHYICLGDGWDKINIMVNSKIKDLKTVYPELFKDMGENQKNCFAPTEVPYSAQKTIDDILARIDAGALDKFHVTVGADSQTTLSNDPSKKKAPLPTSITALGMRDFNNCYSTELGLTKFTSLNNEVEKFELRNEKASFGKKLIRAKLVVGGAEALGMGILITLPRSITKWDEDWMDDAKRNLKRAWTKAPVWDKDEWAINYIGHPLAGAAYYNMLRSQGASRLSSFIFSTVQSTIWEYGIEAIAEQPSIQDLFITPLVGSLIGELAHQGTLRMKRNGFTLGEKILVTIINPSYVLNNGFRMTNKRK